MKKLWSFILAALFLLCMGCAPQKESSSGELEITPNVPSGGDEGEEKPTVPPSGDGEEKPTEPEDTGNGVVVSQIKQKNGRYHISYLGQPYTLLGGQIRADGLTNRGTGDQTPPSGAPAALDYADVEPYIAAAKAFGLNTVEIPVEWHDIEPEKDRYDFTSLDAYMAACNKHGIKMELLWFSTNMCGDTCSFQVPDYIYNDPQTYPRLLTRYGWWDWMYGYKVHLRLDSPALMEREAKACKAITDHIYEWNKANGKQYPVLGIQVQNETDGLLRWRSKPNQADLAARNNMTDAELWQMTLNALDNAGKAFKSGKYKVYTRANMTVSLGAGDFAESADPCSPKDVLALDGIDIVGDDPYTQDVDGIAAMVRSYMLEGNYPHAAENMGAYTAGAALMLSTVAAGGGYCLYDFATPEFFVWMNDHFQSTYQMDQGVLNPDLTEKAHSAEVSKMAKAITACSAPFAALPVQNMAAFGLKSRAGQTETSTLTVGGRQVTFTTDTGAKGFAFTDGETITLFATDNAQFTVAGIGKVGYAGRYNGEAFVRGDKVYPVLDTVTIDNRVVRFELSR